MFSKIVSSGWLHAFFIAFIAYPLGALVSKIIADDSSIHPLIFSITCSIASAAALLLKAGPGGLAVKTLKSAHTWLYSFAGLGVMIFGILIMRDVSATQGAGLYRLTGFIIFLLSFFILHEKISKFELGSSFLILAGALIIIFMLDIPFYAQLSLLFFVVLRGLSQGCKKITVQVHKANQIADNSKDQSRVTAFVIMANGVILLFLSIICAFLRYYGFDFPLLSYMPEFTDFTNFKGYLIAIFLGGVIFSLNSYCDFYASKTIGARYLSTLLAVQILFVFVMESILVKLNIMQAINITSYDMLGLGLILLGNILITVYGFLKVFEK